MSHSGSEYKPENTYFASAERADKRTLQKDVAWASRNPIMTALLETVDGLLAVLNEHRQILTINNSLLEMLDIHDAHEVFGLRYGEAIKCTHSDEERGGCGTSKFCSSCGAAIAVVTSLSENESVERLCAVTVKRGEKQEDLCFRVRSCPIVLKKHRLLLLFLQDVTAHERRAALDRVFFHDINNILTSLLANAEVLAKAKASGSDTEDVADLILQTSLRLKQEVEIQQTLSQSDLADYHLVLKEVTLDRVIQEIAQMFVNHPVAESKFLTIPKVVPSKPFTTDFSLLQRILVNMVKNAFEATDEGGEVKLWVEPGGNSITFLVWNKGVIPKDTARRVFQRHFSTKEGIGRGHGTYAMRLLGETFLGGKVSFSSSESKGTSFQFRLPA